MSDSDIQWNMTVLKIGQMVFILNSTMKYNISDIEWHLIMCSNCKLKIPPSSRYLFISVAFKHF